MNMKSMPWTSGTVLAVGATVALLGCRQREINRKHPCRQDLQDIHHALEAYTSDHSEDLPATLQELYPKYLEDESVLICPGLPVVQGSSPPATYRYVQRRYTEHGDKIVVYANLRGRPGDNAPLFVLRLSGQIECLDAASFEEAIRALGKEYDSLPLWQRKRADNGRPL